MEEKERMKTGKFINQSEKMKDRERKNSSCNRMSKAQSTAGKTALCLASALFLSFVPMGAGICEVPVQVEEEKDTLYEYLYRSRRKRNLTVHRDNEKNQWNLHQRGISGASDSGWKQPSCN